MSEEAGVRVARFCFEKRGIWDLGIRSMLLRAEACLGVSAAYYLARRGARVTLLDASAVGAGASSGNAGLVSLGHLPLQRPGVMGKALKMMFDSDSPLYIAPRLDPALWHWLWRFARACTPAALERNMVTLAQLSTASLGLFEEIHEQSGAGFLHSRTGYMEVFLTRAGLDHCEHDGRITQRYGFKYERIERDELLAREPALTDDVHGAIWYPESSSCDPGRFLRATADLARAAGAAILEGSAVRAIETGDGRASGVSLADGQRIESDCIVLAAGPWSQSLARPLGINLHLQPAKGYHRDVPLPARTLNTACIFGEAGMVGTPMGSFLRLAGTLEFSGLNSTMRRNRLDMLTRGAARYLKGFDTSAQPLSEWVGMRPCTPDGLPTVGWAPNIEGLFIATGHAMLGLSLGPATGKIISQCVLDGGTQLADLKPMRVDRF